MDKIKELKCTNCLMVLSIDNFRKRKDTLFGYRRQCINCDKAKGKKYRLNNVEKVRLQHQRYYYSKYHGETKPNPVIPKEQQCTKCLKVLSIDNFHKKIDSPTGHYRYCKSCVKISIKNAKIIEQNNKEYYPPYKTTKPKPSIQEITQRAIDQETINRLSILNHRWEYIKKICSCIYCHKLLKKKERIPLSIGSNRVCCEACYFVQNGL